MQMLFYATPTDLVDLLSAVERAVPLSYARKGAYSAQTPERFSTSADIPALGVATSDAGIGSFGYLMMSVEQVCVAHCVKQVDGSDLYFVDESHNAETVTLVPAGIRGQSMLLMGRVATNSRSDWPRKVMNRFKSQCKKQFRAIRGIWVGPEAERRMQTGWRLTMSKVSPPEYDLRE